MSTICLYGPSALEYWRFAYRPADATPVPSPDVALETPASRESLRALTPIAGLRTPVHALTLTRESRRSSELIDSHVCLRGLPAGSILDAGHGAYVSSPALTFLQMAGLLNIHELILLGYELCGLYAPPLPQTTRLLQRPQPLTTIAELKRLLALMPGAHGRKAAARALKYVGEQARSPMESLGSMFVGLPRLLGGRGIPQPGLNHRIELDEQGRKLARRSYLVADMYWPQAKLDVEYEGREFHEGASNMAADKARSNALRHMGVHVISLFDEHVRSDEALDAVAADIARHLGVRLRPCTEADAAHRRELRRAVLARPGLATPRWPGMREESPLLADVMLG